MRAKKRDPILKSIGYKIRKVRIEKEMTRSELAHALGITPRSVMNLEKGAHCPSLKTLGKVVELYNVSADYLLGDNAPFYEAFRELSPKQKQFIKLLEPEKLGAADKRSLYNVMDRMAQGNVYINRMDPDLKNDFLRMYQKILNG